VAGEHPLLRLEGRRARMYELAGLQGAVAKPPWAEAVEVGAGTEALLLMHSTMQQRFDRYISPSSKICILVSADLRNYPFTLFTVIVI